MYFPVFVDLTEKNILIVGGGKIASRRMHSLLGFAKHMTVVSCQFTDEILKMADETSVRLVHRPFEAGDLCGRDLVLAATDDAGLNRRIYEDCKKQGIPVNVCSDQSLCDFQFPSILVDEDVVIGLNASGQNHRRVKETRQKLEGFLGAGIEKKNL